MIGSPELYDQEGYLFQMGVGGAVRLDGKLVKARDVDVFVNDERWNGVTYIAARAREEIVNSLGHAPLVIPDGAEGSIEIRSGVVLDEPLHRVMSLETGSALLIVVRDPDDASVLKRISLFDCTWQPPEPTLVLKGKRTQWSSSFRALRYEES